jgi:hypothetical protein
VSHARGCQIEAERVKIKNFEGQMGQHAARSPYMVRNITTTHAFRGCWDAALQSAALAGRQQGHQQHQNQTMAQIWSCLCMICHCQSRPRSPQITTCLRRSEPAPMREGHWSRSRVGLDGPDIGARTRGKDAHPSRRGAWPAS